MSKKGIEVVERSLVNLMVGWMLFKGNETFELFVSVRPNHENVIYVSLPDEGLIHITFKCFPLKLSHKNIGEGWAILVPIVVPCR